MAGPPAGDGKVKDERGTVHCDAGEGRSDGYDGEGGYDGFVEEAAGGDDKEEAACRMRSRCSTS
ncbi:hypothetical protein GCM10009670_28730 [Citricoccus alkalitolerans]